jgi:hypothetical protein
MTPEKYKLLTGVNDTGYKFFAGVVDTAEQLITGVNNTGDKHSTRLQWNTWGPGGHSFMKKT